MPDRSNVMVPTSRPEHEADGPRSADAARCLIIGEVAQAHDGSLGMAHAYIDAAAHCGVDAVKFQTHIADAESTPDEQWRVRFSAQDDSRQEYWRRMEFSEEQWVGLKEHAERAGLLFVSSPFSGEAVDLLTRVGVSAWKVASGEVNTPDILDAITRTRLPVWISTGMSAFAEIDRAVDLVRAGGSEVAVLQCTSIYPTPAERLGLNVIPLMRDRYRCPVGLSDHSGVPAAGLAAATIGIDLLEVHMTLSRDLFGPDVPVSLTPSEITDLVRGVRFIERAMGHPVDKDALQDELHDMRSLFTKSLIVTEPIAEGGLLTESVIGMRKPGTGIPAGRLNDVVGRTAARDLHPYTILTEGDIAWDA